MATVDFSDIYECREFVDAIKKKHIELDDEELEMGIFGYLGDIHANILQNSAQTAAENALEGLPTKAKYTKNLYTHAYSLGLDVLATPAVMQACLILPESALDKNLDYQNRFILDKDFPITIESLEYHLDYDVIIRKVVLPGKDVAYSAMYDMTYKNLMSDITNPYIQSIGRFTVDNINVLMLNVLLRQVNYKKIEEAILTSNPLQNKTFNFSFSNQLAGFDVNVREGDDLYHLNAVYDGLIDNTGSKYLNYLFLKEDTIRCIFKRESYQPRINCRIDINLYTTMGSEGNFKKYTGNLSYNLKSDRFNYSGMWMIMKPLSDSSGGADMKSVSQLRKSIPKEQLARGTVTNSRDLENFFNSINTPTKKLYFIKKLDSLDRLYYSYVALKSEGNIIPANTIDMEISRSDFDLMQYHNYALKPGNCIYYRRNTTGSIITQYLQEENKMEYYKNTGFLYFNPFLMVVNKNPFYVSYLIDIINCYRTLNFTYINQQSNLQFIANEIQWKREFFTDRNIYKLYITLTCNTLSRGMLKENIYIYDDNRRVIDVKMKVIAVLKAADGTTPLRYTYGSLVVQDQIEEDGMLTYKFEFETDNMMDKDMKLKLKNLYDINQTYKIDGYFSQDTQIDIYICPKLGDEIGGKEEISYICPDLTGYCCTNIYSVINGVPLYYNYSNVMSTFINVEQGQDSSLSYYIKKVPVIKYDYIIIKPDDTLTDPYEIQKNKDKCIAKGEERLNHVIEELQLVKSYIEYKLSQLEDSFGVDVKLFNTYGPAKFYLVDDGALLDNVSLKINFKTQLTQSADDQIVTDIKNFIKDKIENFDTIGDLHFPNLQAEMTRAFTGQIEYIEFAGFNDYDQRIQHIYRDEFESDISKVPEILSINTLSTDEPNINIVIQAN